MKPIKFPGSNIVFGEGQPEYIPLPALRMEDGQVITCWELSDDEIEGINHNRKIYISQLTFNQPLQPLKPMTGLDDGIIIT